MQNRHISATIWLILTKFGTLHEFYASDRVLNNSDLENPTWQMPAILKNKKSPYLCKRLTYFDEIWHGDASPSAPDWALKISDFENPQWQMFFKSSKFLWTFYGRGKRLLNKPVTYLSNS